MKSLSRVLLVLLATSACPAIAQDAPAGVPVPPALRPPIPPTPPPAPPESPRFSGFTSFSIDFEGGSPADLVHRITNETRKALNVIIPREHATTQLPPLRLSNVTVPQLFEALEQSSKKKVPYTSGTYGAGGAQPSYTSIQQASTGFGFRTAPPPREDSIWYFYVEAVPEMPTPPSQVDPEETVVCRFFQLAPFLDQGLTPEDITTAVETAWNMLEEQSGEKTGTGFGPTNRKPVRASRLEKPNMKFHEDTKLLIVVGPHGRVLLIDEILNHLRVPLTMDPATGLPIPHAPSPGSVGPITPPAKSAPGGGRGNNAPAE